METIEPDNQLKEQREKEKLAGQREKKMQSAILELQKKFGKNAVLKGMNLEKKSKVRGMCLKESCPLTPEECERMLRGEFVTAAPGDPAVRKRLLAEINVRGMMPKTIVTYERVPLVYSGGNVRITFDRRITSSEDLRHFLTADYTERPVLPPGQSILEVKWDELMPGFIRENLNMEDLQWIAFSKYYLCRTIHN